MIEAALAAASQILTPPFRRALWKTLALTLGLLSFVWITLHKLIVAGAALASPWGETLSWVSGVGLFAGLAFLVSPVSFIIAGFFFDELAATVEKGLAPGDAPGRTLPLQECWRLTGGFSLRTLSLLPVRPKAQTTLPD